MQHCTEILSGIMFFNLTRPDFEKAYLRLPKHIQNLATRKDQWLREDAFDLQTH